MAKAKTAAKKSKAAPAKAGGWYDDMSKKISKGSGDFFDLSKQPAGTIQIRPIGFTFEGRTAVFVNDFQHFKIPDVDKGILRCQGEDCPICDLKTEISSELWDAIKPTNKVLLNAIVRGPVDKFVIARIPASVRDKMAKYYDSENEALYLGDDAVSDVGGYDFVISITGPSGMGRRYPDATPARKSSKWGIENIEPKNLFDAIKDVEESTYRAAVKALRAKK